MKSLLLFVMILCVGSVAAQPKAGTLDNSFGKNGTVVFRFPDGGVTCYSLAAQSDEKIICVGIASASAGYEGLSILRFSKDGLLDSSFGNNGSSFINFLGYDLQRAHAVSIQPDDKIIVVGSASKHVVNPRNEPDYDMIIGRLNANGSIDSTFSDDGKVIADYSKGQGNGDLANDIVVQPDRKIIVHGVSSSSFNTLRFLADGSLDKSFGDNGSVITKFSGQAFGNAVALQADNKIVVTGSDYSKVLVVRYLPDGSLDSGFGEQGIVRTDISSGPDMGEDIYVEKNGKIIVGGNSSSIFQATLFLTRYNTDGSLDKSFGKDGIVSDAIGFASAASCLAVQKDGKILAGGIYAEDIGALSDFHMARYLPNGNLDLSFGDNGSTVTSITSSETVYGLLLQKDGKILLGGTSNYGDAGDVVLARYYNDISVSPPPPPIIRIKRWLHKHGITWDDCPPSICDKISSYAIQHSNNNINWKTVYSSKANLNSYIDPSPLPGTNYYRLQIIGTDGAVVYSNVIAINNESSLISLSPNPAKNVLHIDGLPSSAKITITVVDLAGNVASSLQLKANISSYNLNVSKLKPGNYLLHIETADSVITNQFVKE